VTRKLASEKHIKAKESNERRSLRVFSAPVIPNPGSRDPTSGGERNPGHDPDVSLILSSPKGAKPAS